MRQWPDGPNWDESRRSRRGAFRQIQAFVRSTEFSASAQRFPFMPHIRMWLPLARPAVTPGLKHLEIVTIREKARVGRQLAAPRGDGLEDEAMRWRELPAGRRRWALTCWFAAPLHLRRLNCLSVASSSGLLKPLPTEAEDKKPPTNKQHQQSYTVVSWKRPGRCALHYGWARCLSKRNLAKASIVLLGHYQGGALLPRYVPLLPCPSSGAEPSGTWLLGSPPRFPSPFP
ncbi:hypothetical protein B0T19DRAFT_197836 [Cercophora scortea]|uniref:Uncharacterized protein n=1 Tax=Cercophora scortea TaxID=314031 RepID=A0AAE0MDY5_9PEZI|nr:hypothetical protein B0T19DRAFT_197836 [Cercophora scortea]